MPCQTLQRRDMQCHAMQCNATQRNTTPRHATPFNAMQHYTTPWNTLQCHAKYVKLHPKLAYDCSYHVPPYQRNQLSRNLSHCTQNWHIIIDTIHHQTKVTNQLQNMSHCTQNWHMIMDTIHHQTIVTNQLRNMSHCTQNWHMIVDTIHHQTIETNCCHIAPRIGTWS